MFTRRQFDRLPKRILGFAPVFTTRFGKKEFRGQENNYVSGTSRPTPKNPAKNRMLKPVPARIQLPGLHHDRHRGPGFIPEPSTWLLIAIGAVALLTARLRSVLRR
jgi:hypothetical protein